MEHASELLKLALRARYAFAIWVTGVLALKLGPTFLQIDSLITDYGKWIGGATLVAFIVWLIEIWMMCIEWAKEWREGRRETENIKAFLETLSREEKSLLSTALSSGNQTIFGQRTDNEIVLSLLAKKLVQQGPKSGELRSPCVIRPEVWKLLLKQKSKFVNGQNQLPE